MAKIDSISSAKNTANEEKRISSLDIQVARCILDSNCSALSAIANAVEVLSSLDPKPEKLFSHTITRLMAHSVYLADTVDNDLGCFIEKVEESAQSEQSHQATGQEDRLRMAIDAVVEVAELNHLAYTSDIGEAGRRGLCLRIDDLTVIALSSLSDDLAAIGDLRSRLYGENILQPTH